MRTRIALVALVVTLAAPRAHAQASVEERFDQLQRALEAQRAVSERQQEQLEAQAANPASLANPTPFGAAPNTPPTGVQIGQEYDVIGLRSQFGF